MLIKGGTLLKWHKICRLAGVETEKSQVTINIAKSFVFKLKSSINNKSVEITFQFLDNRISLSSNKITLGPQGGADYNSGMF